jgi:hypothetical protein
MAAPNWVVQLFRSIDAQDERAFVSYLTENAVFCFGNAPEVRGRQKIQDAVAAFFKSVKGLRHALLDTWQQSGAVICRGQVTYTRLDDKQVTVPFVNILLMEGEKARDYRIYVDVGPLFAPTA